MTHFTIWTCYKRGKMFVREQVPTKIFFLIWLQKALYNIIFTEGYFSALNL